MGAPRWTWRRRPSWTRSSSTSDCRTWTCWRSSADCAGGSPLLIIVLSARQTSQEKVAALDEGADDDVKDLPYRSGLFPLGPIFAFVLCLIITQPELRSVPERQHWTGAA